MGVHGCAPRPSSPECANVDVAEVLEATADTRSDWAVLVAMWRRCMLSLAAFGAMVWFLEDVGRRRQGGVP